MTETQPDKWPDEATAEDALAVVVGIIADLPANAGQPDFTIGHRHESAGGDWYWEVSYRTVLGSAKLPCGGIDRHRAITDATRVYLKAVDRDRGLPVDDEEGSD